MKEMEELILEFLNRYYALDRIGLPYDIGSNRTLFSLTLANIIERIFDIKNEDAGRIVTEWIVSKKTPEIRENVLKLFQSFN